MLKIEVDENGVFVAVKGNIAIISSDLVMGVRQIRGELKGTSLKLFDDFLRDMFVWLVTADEDELSKGWKKDETEHKQD